MSDKLNYLLASKAELQTEAYRLEDENQDLRRKLNLLLEAEKTLDKDSWMSNPHGHTEQLCVSRNGMESFRAAIKECEE